MTKLEELKKAIQAANPEIIELKFGCEVEYSYFTEVSYEVLGREEKIGMVQKENIHFHQIGNNLKKIPDGMKSVKLLYFGADVLYFPEANEDTFSKLKEIGIINPTYITKILGRPIRWDDVRKIIRQEYWGEFAEIWRDGLLSDQPEVVIDWIYANKSSEF